MIESVSRRLIVVGISAVAACILWGGPAQAQTVTYGYDALGRLTSVARSDGTSVAYAYDDAGNRTSVVASGVVGTPDPFELGGPVTDAVAGASYDSAAPVLSGFVSPLPITVSGGQYRIASGSWTGAAGMVSSGQAVRVRVQAPSAGGASQTATLTVGGVSDTFSVTTAADTIPTAFDLGGPYTGASGSWVVSNTIAIAGINAAAPISIAGGQYRIDSGSWTSTAGTVTVGQSVQVRAQAPAAAGTSQTATLVIGGVSDTFLATAAADTTPAAFNLGGPSTGASGAWVESSLVTVAGINAAAPVSITGGQFRINGGAWQTAAATVTAGQTVQVRAQAPAAGGTSQTATLTIGGVSDTFLATAASDTTPSAFNLGGPSIGASGAWVASSTVTVAGINAAAPISITGGQFRINGGAWQTAAATVTAGQSVQVRAQAPAAGGTSQTATLTIGGVSGAFLATAASDTTPNAFNLGGPTTGESGSWVASSTVTVAGINAATSISVTGGQYRIGGGSWTSSAGTVTVGQTVQVRAQAPASGGASQTATLTIGGVSDTFLATATMDTTPNPFGLGGPVTSAPGVWVQSSAVTVAGINAPASVSVSNAQFRINGGPWQTAPATVTAGQTIQIQVYASAPFGSFAVGTLTIGGVSDSFVVQLPCVPPPGQTQCVSDV